MIRSHAPSWWALALTAACLHLIAANASWAATPHEADIATRRDMTDRAMQFLLSIEKDGSVGDTRKNAVTPLFILASLSSGHRPDDALAGPALLRCADWLLTNSANEFLGGAEQPNEDHALAALALMELVGTSPDPAQRRNWYERAQLAFEYALKIQDRGVGAEHFGGWKPNDQTRINDRVLTAWYMHLLYAGQLRGFEIPRTSMQRAGDFLAAAQKGKQHAKVEERGGFSLDAQGLTVRSATGAALAALTLLSDSDPDNLAAARDWLTANPPRWHGPSFFETHFFALRGLYRIRHMDDGRAFKAYLDRTARIIRERQKADGSVPFPPGHARPVTDMGPGYSTSMAVLILNVDRGLLPLDR